MSELSRLRGSEEYVACSDEVMAHRPTGSTQTDRIRLPDAARRLSLSRWGQSPVSAKEERVSRLPSARAERIRRASRPGSVGSPDSASCGYPRTHEGFRPCHRGCGYTGGSYSRRSTAALAPWPRCHRRRPRGSPKRAAGPFPLWMGSVIFLSLLSASAPTTLRATPATPSSGAAERRSGTSQQGYRSHRLSGPGCSAKSKRSALSAAKRKTPRPQARCRYVDRSHATRTRCCRWGNDPRRRACPVPPGTSR